MKYFLIAAATVIALFVFFCSKSGQPVGDLGFPNTPAQFYALSAEDLKARFLAGDGTRMPRGEYRGTALIKPGTILGQCFSCLTSVLWKGKVFNPDQSEIYNLIGPFANEMIRGDLSTTIGLDGKPSIRVTYNPDLGDEIRWLGGNTFLGRGVNKGEYGVYFFMIGEAITDAKR